MTPSALEALRRVAEARKATGLAALEALLGARRACEAEIGALRAARTAEDADPLAAPPEALAARMRWTDHRIAEIRRGIDELDRRIAAARAALAISLGKDMALTELRDRAAREAHRLRATREDRDAPPPGGRRGDWER